MTGGIKFQLRTLSRAEVETLLQRLRYDERQIADPAWVRETFVQLCYAYLGLLERNLRLLGAGEDLATVIDEASARGTLADACGQTALRAWDHVTVGE